MVDGGTGGELEIGRAYAEVKFTSYHQYFGKYFKSNSHTTSPPLAVGEEGGRMVAPPVGDQSEATLAESRLHPLG